MAVSLGYSTAPSTVPMQNVDRNVPASATVNGVEVAVYSAGAGIAYDTVRLVIDGTPQGDNLAGGQIVDANQLDHGHFGGASNLWGLASITPTQANNLELEVAYAGVAITDRVNFIVHWEDAPSCVLQAVSPTMGGEAPYLFVAEAFESVYEGTPDQASVVWEVTGPAGWTQTCQDPRYAQTRDCAAEVRGWDAAWLFDVPGQYTVSAKLYSGLGPPVQGNQLVVDVAASTRTVYYLDNNLGLDSNDGSQGAPWQTVGHALTQINTGGGNAELVVADDTTETVSTPVTLTANSVHIHRSVTGTNKPQFTRDTGGQVWGFAGVADLTIDGIRVDSTTAPTSAPNFMGTTTTDWTRVCITNCEAGQIQSFAEMSAAGSSSGVCALKGSTNSVDIRGVSVEEGQQNYLVADSDGGDDHTYVTEVDLTVSYAE